MKILLLLAVPPLLAQQALTLRDAVAQAMTRHPSVEAAAARLKAADLRIAAAKSGYLPRLAYQESFQAGNNPVFVFSSKLTQRQFAQADFAIDRLVHPDATTNFQSLVTADQMIWDAGRTKTAASQAGAARQMSAEEKRNTEQMVIAGVARAYHGVTVAEEALEVAGRAVQSAEADLKRVENVRAAGMTTDADVLAVKVHLAAAREMQIQRKYDVSVARAALNEAIGLPLDTQVTLTSKLEAAPRSNSTAKEFEDQASVARTEVRMTRIAQEMAGLQARQAKQQLFPQVGLRGSFEADRKEFYRKGGANWFVGATFRWDFFDGKRSFREMDVARANLEAAKADQRRAENSVRLQARKAWADSQAAAERLNVTSTAEAQAEETLRIIRNRYESGLTTVTELLRAETALTEARMRHLAAAYDQRVSRVQLEMAAGALNGDSNVLQ